MRGEVDFDELSGRARFTRRDPDPRGPSCPRHLKRICGTCTHFAGGLRGEGPHACGYFEVQVTSGRPANKCTRWARK